MIIKKTIESYNDFLKIYLNEIPPPPRTFECDNKKYTIISLSEINDDVAIIKDENNNIVDTKMFINKTLKWNIKNYDYLDEYVVTEDFDFLDLINNKCQFVKLMDVFGNIYLIRIFISDEKINDYHIALFDNLIDYETKNQFYNKYPKAKIWLKKYFIYKLRKLFKKED